MRLVSTHRLQAGAVVARGVRAGAPGTAPLVLAGARLTESMCRRLAALGVDAVWVHDELSAGIEPLEPLPAETREAAERDVVATLARAREALSSGEQMSPRDTARLASVAAAIAEEVAGLPEAAYALSEMRMADAYTHEHSVRVTTLGLLLASHHWRRHGWKDSQQRTRFDNLPERLAQLGFGLLVHDIGKLAIPREVLDKPGRLDEFDWELVRRHPDLGAEMLNPTSTSLLALSVIRFHHERWDGGGYPRGLSTTRIPQMARIAAVADVYDAVRSERPYKAAKPPHVGVEVVRSGAGAAFDPEVVRTFCEVVMPYPVGHEVTLEDGREGVVVDVDPRRPNAPLVRVREDDGSFWEGEVDLARQRLPAG